MTFHDCCRAIIADKTAKSVDYAVGYAQSGLLMPEDSLMAKVQSLYLLNNITHWRNAAAKETRAALRKIGEDK